MSFIWIILTFFYKITRKDVILLKKLLYNFVDIPQSFCIYFVSLLNCVNIFNINAHLLFIIFGLLFIFKIILHLIARLRFCSDGFIDICLLSHHQIVSIWSFFWWSSQFSFQTLNRMFPIKIYCNLIILVVNGQPNEPF